MHCSGQKSPPQPLHHSAEPPWCWESIQGQQQQSAPCCATPWCRSGHAAAPEPPGAPEPPSELASRTRSSDAFRAVAAFFARASAHCCTAVPSAAPRMSSPSGATARASVQPSSRANAGPWHRTSRPPSRANACVRAPRDVWRRPGTASAASRALHRPRARPGSRRGTRRSRSLQTAGNGTADGLAWGSGVQGGSGRVISAGRQARAGTAR